MKMEVSVLMCVFGLLYTLSAITVQSCPLNCICDEYKTVCQVKTCEDELPLDYTDYLVIDGPLCVNQLMFLNDLSPNMIIFMRTHPCEGLRNCRSNGVLPTGIPGEYLPTEDNFIPDVIPIPIPGHIPEVPEAGVPEAGVPEAGVPEPEVVPEIEQPEVVPEIEQPEAVPEIEQPEVVPEIEQPEAVPEIEQPEVVPEIEQPEVEPVTEASITTEGTTEETTVETTESTLIPIEEEDEGSNSTVSIYRG